MYFKIAICSCVLLLTISVARASGDEAPAWLQQAAAMKVPVYDKDVPAVVLRHDQSVVVDSDGRVTISTIFAVRILRREGRGFARAVEGYLTNSSKVRELTAWLVRANGFVKKYGKDETADRIMDANDIYNEYRVKAIDASTDADTDEVFGYQATTEDRPLFNQDTWNFQTRLPTLTSRYSLTLPSGWKATSITFNHAKIEPSVNGSTYLWQLGDLPPIKYEPASPGVQSLAPRIAVNYFVPESGQGVGAKGFEDWVQVSRWGTALHDPQAIPDASVTAKARELTANSQTELDRIRAIARFVQGLQYISIDIGIGRGNGYRPHSASQVLAKAYGDCKDKANLMRAMLQAINISAYPVFIYLGDPVFVRQEWASPRQFNHCIIAVKVSDETQSPTVIQHATLGRLLIFDATDPHTPLGDLPEVEQGSYALLAAGEAGQLMRMPTLPPESSFFDRQTQVMLSSDGAISASLSEKANGQTAADFRREFRHMSAPQYLRTIESWVSDGAPAAKVSKIEPTDNKETGRFDLNVEFTALAYGQLMQNRLLVFKPAVVSRREALSLTEPTRRYPVVLEARAYSETVRVKLPVDFAVDELPDAVKLDTTFGSYKTSYEVKDGELVFTRTLAQRAGSIPVDQYQSVRTFFEKIRAAEQAPVVLIRK